MKPLLIGILLGIATMLADVAAHGRFVVFGWCEVFVAIALGLFGNFTIGVWWWRWNRRFRIRLTVGILSWLVALAIFSHGIHIVDPALASL